MKVSIITVCLNSEKHIQQTIRSVLKQTYKEVEYIIIDGMSSDSTLKIIEKYKPLFGERLKLISEKDSGIYDAMNKGIGYATGEIIGIINSDDWYEEDTVEKVVEIYQSKKDTVVYGAVAFIDNEKIIGVDVSNYKQLYNKMINHTSIFVPRKFYDKFGMFDINYKIAADYDFMLRLFSNNINFTFIPKVLASFRMDGVSSLQQDRCKSETLMIREKYGCEELRNIDYKNDFYLLYLRKRLIDYLENTNSRNIYIYGSGSHTELLLDLFPNKLKKKIIGIIDKDVNLNNEYKFGYSLFDIRQIEDNSMDIIIISSITYENEIYNRISKLKHNIKIVTIYKTPKTIDGINNVIRNIEI